MPLRRHHGAAAAAVLLALGGTAVLTWAFSVFSEDKDKKPRSKPKDKLAAAVDDGNKVELPGNISAVAAERHGVLIPSKCDFIPEYFYRTLADKSTPLVIENKSVTDPAPPSDQETQSGQDNPSTNSHSDAAEEPTSPFFSKPTTLATSIYTQTRLTQKVQHLDDAYNESLVRTPLADAVKENLVRISFNELESTRSQSLSSYDEMDNKVTVVEERKPAVEEMKLPDILEMETMTTSVSSKSLQSATRTAPPVKPKRSLGMLMSVDNAVRQMEEANGGEPITMVMEEETEQDGEFSRSISLSQHSFSRTISRPSNSEGDSVDGSASKTRGNADGVSSGGILDGFPAGEIHNHISGKCEELPDPITMEISDDTFSYPQSSAKVTSGSLLQQQKSSREVPDSEFASLSQGPGYDTSSYMGMLSIAGRISEGYFMNLNLSADSLEPYTQVVAESLDENENVSEKDDSLDSQSQISTYYVDISNNKMEKSEYHSPHPLERQLTPEKPPNKAERSELQLNIGSKRKSNTNQYENVPLLNAEPRTSTPTRELNESRATESPLMAEQADVTAASPTLAIADDQVDHLERPNSVASNISSGSIEFTRTQQTEAEEVVETSVEETVTMVITGVLLNPGVEGEQEVILSMQDAVNRGILDLANGLYYNSITNSKMPLIEAMNLGYIKMGPKKVEKSEEKVKSVGRITIKTSRETMPYIVRGVKDMRSGKVVSLEKAKELKLLDMSSGVFRNARSGDTMLIGDAVDLGLVDIEYDVEATGTIQEEITKTYSVHAVVDQSERCKLPFHEAVSRGIIDPDTGGYINNITGQVIPAEEAISKGLIKATLATDGDSVTVDKMGSKVAEKGVAAIRKKLLNPIKVLKSMKKS